MWRCVHKYRFSNIGTKTYIGYPRLIINAKYISIGNSFKTHKNFRIEAIDEYLGQYFQPKITIGNNVSIQVNCHIGCINKITIGNGVLMASNVFITDHFHGKTNGEYKDIPPAKRPLFSKGSVKINDNVWIGENVVILPNVTIGEGAIIGANSTVVKDIPAYSVAAGNPAHIIKYIDKL